MKQNERLLETLQYFFKENHINKKNEGTSVITPLAVLLHCELRYTKLIGQTWKSVFEASSKPARFSFFHKKFFYLQIKKNKILVHVKKKVKFASNS